MNPINAKRRAIVSAGAVGLLVSGCAFGDAAMSGDMGLTPGGSRDIGLAREKIDQGIVPAPEDFVVEGLLSEHDLPIDGAPCDRVVCARAAVGIAPSFETDRREAFVQIGFSTNIDGATFKRRPQNVVAVVDISGSMSGEKMESTRDALKHLVDQLGKDDSFALVAFDDEAELRVSATPGDHRQTLGRAIDRLVPKGGTCIECGLRLGYERALKSHGPDRDSRVMLFTDAQPNVGATGEGEFIQLITQHADRVGLTAFGVGLDFGQELALAISRIRGGNYVFLRDGEAIRKAFEELDYLVTPVAYDLKLEIEPGDGFTLSAVHGISTWEPGDPSVTIDVPTLFFSSRRGAIVVRFEGEPAPGEPIVHASLSYEEVTGELYETALQVDFTHDEPLQEDATWFSQPGVRKTVALTNFATGASSVCGLWWDLWRSHRWDDDARSEPAGIADALANHLQEEANALDDEGVAAEAELARKLAALMAIDDQFSDQSPE